MRGSGRTVATAPNMLSGNGIILDADRDQNTFEFGKRRALTSAHLGVENADTESYPKPA